MELNANFEERAIVHAGKLKWQASPMKGVDRRMLDRLGDEVARATSIVRYAPGSHFSPHTHTGGEEFFVLEGVFQDEHGDFPAGTYVRNPPTTSHTPSSDGGCTIFVKLWQFDMNDRHQMRFDTNNTDWKLLNDGSKIMELYKDANEHVYMSNWPANQSVELNAPSGMEVLVISGNFTVDEEQFDTQSWLRMPCNDRLTIKAGHDGCKVWIKQNHLEEIPKPPTQ